MKKLFGNFWIFLVDRFTGRNAKNFEVYNEVMTIPNLVTINGILLTLLYVVMYSFGLVISLIPVVVVLIVLTDALDGYCADRFNQHSQYGKVLDPLRDRLFTLALLGNIWLIAGNEVLLTMIVIVLLEINLALHYRRVFLSTGKIAEVHWLGKARSALQWLLGFGILIQFYWLGVTYISPASVVLVMFMASFAVNLNTFVFRR